MAKDIFQDMEALRKRAIEQFDDIESKERDQRKLAITDMVFTHTEGGQWTDDAIQKRSDRPRFTVNKMSGVVDQIVGDQRQNKIAIDVVPLKDGEKKTAKTLEGLIRSIEVVSVSKNAYDNAFNEQVTCGYGGWRVITEIPDDDTFDQELLIEPIMSAASCLYFDPMAQKYDKRDASYAFYLISMSKTEFNSRYPDKAIADFDHELYRTQGCSDWYKDDAVRVAEYWYKEPVKKTILLMSDGRVLDKDDEEAVLDELAAQGITPTKERVIDSHVVKMIVISGMEVLEGPKDWAGKYIPLIPLFGKTTKVEDQTYIRGIVRFAKDSQRIYNYAVSSAIEATALAPKDPYWATATHIGKDGKKLSEDIKRNSPVLKYNHDSKEPGPPRRSGAPQLQAALIQQTQQASMDIHATTGLEPASLGNSPELKSGKAILAQQAMGDRGSFVFTDNLQKSIKFTGDILVDMIPRIYDTQRTVKILGLDGVSEDVNLNTPLTNNINQVVIDEDTGEEVIVNDLSKGKYGTTVTTGPSYNSKREKTADQLFELIRVAPALQPIALDLIVKNLDILESEEMNQRVRLGMIKQGTIEPTEEEVKDLGLDQPQQPDPTQVAITENIQMQTQEKMAKIQNMNADTVSKAVKSQQEATVSLQNLMEIMLEKTQAGITLSDEDLALLRGQKAITQESQIGLIKAQTGSA